MRPSWTRRPPAALPNLLRFPRRARLPRDTVPAVSDRRPRIQDFFVRSWTNRRVLQRGAPALRRGNSGAKRPEESSAQRQPHTVAHGVWDTQAGFRGRVEASESNRPAQVSFYEIDTKRDVRCRNLGGQQQVRTTDLF